MFHRAKRFCYRHVDLSGRVRSHTRLPPYERLSCLPAFAVTTSWGSPYMIFDQLDGDEGTREIANHDFFETGQLPSQADDDTPTTPDTDNADDTTVREVPRSPSAATTTTTAAEESELAEDSARQNLRTRTTALFFTDPDEAAALVDEMKQMGDGMGRADVRVMAMSLARAVRQSTRLGRGVPTGQAVDEATGALGEAAIRYKLVPSSRELYYAATRCVGRERVGLGFGESRENDAKRLLNPRDGPAGGEDGGVRERLDGRGRKQSKQSSDNTPETYLQRAYQHMKGKTGVPVFYAKGMKRRLTKNNIQIPIYMSYEDLMESWSTMKKEAPSDTIPDQPPYVEVFNMMDLMVAMDRNQLIKRKLLKNAVTNALPSAVATHKYFGWARRQPFWAQFTTTGRHSVNSLPQIGEDELDQLVFVPSSRAIRFKEKATSRGNNKARLKRMR